MKSPTFSKICNKPDWLQGVLINIKHSSKGVVLSSPEELAANISAGGATNISKMYPITDIRISPLIFA